MPSTRTVTPTLHLLFMSFSLRVGPLWPRVVSRQSPYSPRLLTFSWVPRMIVTPLSAGARRPTGFGATATGTCGEEPTSLRQMSRGKIERVSSLEKDLQYGFISAVAESEKKKKLYK